MSKATLIAGLAYGDEGKGTMTDYFVRKTLATLVVRYNGGPQAGHRVVTPNGRSHVFSQLGSGTFVGAMTLLSQYTLFEPYRLFRELQTLATQGIREDDAINDLFVDRRALVITPYQWAANRLKEMARGDARHGSCGMGVGETRGDFLAHNIGLFAGDLLDRETLRHKLLAIRDLKTTEINWNGIGAETKEVRIFTRPIQEFVDEYYNMARSLQIVGEDFWRTFFNDYPDSNLVFEGAQGVLLDETYGFHPYTTWTDCTFNNAIAILNEAGFAGEIHKVGVIRAYGTRHGEGPFVTQDTIDLPDPNNTLNPWQGTFRVGHFDTLTLRYALKAIGGVDEIAITNMDRVLFEANRPSIKVCVGYERNGTKYEDIPFLVNPSLASQIALSIDLHKCKPIYADEIQFGGLRHVTGLPLKIVSYGPTAKEKTTV